MSQVQLSREQEFEDYILEEELGQGGEGTVYQARKKKTGEKVSLKISKKPIKKTKAQIAEEAKPVTDLGEKLNHPGIVKIKKAGIFRKKPFIELEFFEGKSLDKILKGYQEIQFGTREQYIPTETALDITIQIAQALGYAHKKDVTHGDIKPPNILINPENQIKLIDFGLDRLESTDLKNSFSVSGEIVGSLGYMSPQRQKGESATPLDDVFSMGAVLYQLLTNQLPADNNFQKDPSEINPELPIRLNKIYRKMIAANPQDRYQSTQSIVKALKETKKFLYTSEKQPSPILLVEESDEHLREFLTGPNGVHQKINSLCKELLQSGKSLEARWTKEYSKDIHHFNLEVSPNQIFLRFGLGHPTTYLQLDYKPIGSSRKVTKGKNLCRWFPLWIEREEDVEVTQDNQFLYDFNGHKGHPDAFFEDLIEFSHQANWIIDHFKEFYKLPDYVHEHFKESLKTSKKFLTQKS